jgi:hypothetical protein
MSDKKQTAVEWFKKELEDYGSNSHLSLDWNTFDELYQQAKEMDIEQKKHAYDWGETNGADECNGDGATHENFEQYYQETYGGNK